ncbi:MAG: phosphoribosylformylglycinamidine synthase subunit PurQ [Alphaproteobacteria bacterium]|nr:phosphoribosylformylglycinamidine synthase subunit PurQ [Alphaproteobacteria bacterium]
MKSAIILFPGTNREKDMADALRRAGGAEPAMVWHRETTLPPVDLIVAPGGFSYGDYLRCGAMAGNSPIMRAVAERAKAGVHVLGVCNGFQILTEVGLLPGALMRNAGLKFICKTTPLRIENSDTAFTHLCPPDRPMMTPVAHNEGAYVADPETLDRLEGEGRVVFRYADENGAVTEAANINGSQRNIAGVINDAGTVLGMMPHPENATAPHLAGVDGLPLFRSLVERLS